MVPSRRMNNQNWLPSIFNDFFDNEWMERSNATAPAINVLENEKSYDLEVAAPGMTKEDFKVTLDENGDLVINMERNRRTMRTRRMVTTSVASSHTANISRQCFCRMTPTEKRSMLR